MATAKRPPDIRGFTAPRKRGPASESEGVPSDSDVLSETEETKEVDEDDSDVDDSDVSSDSDDSEVSSDSEGSDGSESGSDEPGPSKAKPRRKRKVTSAAVAAMQLLVTSVAAMTDRRKQVQAGWTELRNASVDERGEQQVPGAGLLQPVLGKYGLRVCTCCDTVKKVKKMNGKNSYCTLCDPRKNTGKARRAQFRRRVAAARAALYERHRDVVAIGSRFEVWLLQQLRKAGFIVKLNYEFCRADLLIQHPTDPQLWYRIQAKGSECTGQVKFGDTFGYGSRAGGVKEQKHRMLVVCGRKDGDAYTLWAMDGGEIPANTLHVSKADVLAEKSLNLPPTKLEDLVARIHTDLKKKKSPYPLTTADAAELDITEPRQLKEKVLTLALRECGVCEVEYPPGNQTCIDCSAIFEDDDQSIATQVKTHNFKHGKAGAKCNVNGARWPYPHNCGIERMLEGAIVAKEGADGKWTFWVIYAYQDYEALKKNLFSNVEEGSIGTGSIAARFETAKQAKEWAGVEQKTLRAETKWLAEPRHCFQRAQVPVEGRLTHDLLWKCTSRFVDRNGRGSPTPPKRV